MMDVFTEAERLRMRVNELKPTRKTRRKPKRPVRRYDAHVWAWAQHRILVLIADATIRAAESVKQKILNGDL